MMSQSWNIHHTNEAQTAEAFPVSQCEHKTMHRNNIFTCFEDSWKLFMEGSAQHPCKEGKENKKCCHYWTRQMNFNLKAIMLVMRMAIGRGLSHFNVTDFMLPFYEQKEYSRFVKFHNQLIKQDSKYQLLSGYLIYWMEMTLIHMINVKFFIILV